MLIASLELFFKIAQAGILCFSCVFPELLQQGLIFPKVPAIRSLANKDFLPKDCLKIDFFFYRLVVASRWNKKPWLQKVTKKNVLFFVWSSTIPLREGQRRKDERLKMF